MFDFKILYFLEINTGQNKKEKKVNCVPVQVHLCMFVPVCTVQHVCVYTYVYMLYIYVGMYMCLCIHAVCMCVHVHISMCVLIFMSTLHFVDGNEYFMCICVYVWLHVYICDQVFLYVCLCVCMYMCLHFPMCICVSVSTHLYMFTFSCVYLYACILVIVYMLCSLCEHPFMNVTEGLMCIYVCLHMCACVISCVYVYLPMCVCMYVHVLFYIKCLRTKQLVLNLINVIKLLKIDLELKFVTFIVCRNLEKRIIAWFSKLYKDLVGT